MPPKEDATLRKSYGKARASMGYKAKPSGKTHGMNMTASLGKKSGKGTKRPAMKT